MQLKYHASALFTAHQMARLGIGLMSLLGSAPALAQANEDELIEAMMTRIAGTQRVYAQPYMTSGKLAGCHLIFEAMIRDFTYRQGQFIKVDGNVGLMGVGDNVAVVLKVVVNEVTPPSITFKPSPPSRAYLIDPNFMTNMDSLVSASESDTPGSLFSVFQLSPSTEIIMSALEYKKITVAFNQKGGASDLQLSLELDVAQTDNNGGKIRSNEAVKSFAQCALILMQQAR